MTAYAADPAPAENHTPTRAGALAGVRVLEMGQLLAGPYCAQLMADHGADVVKIEDPQRGDVMRQWGQKADDRSLWWPIVARNKRSVTCDLRTPEGREIARALAGEADIVVENFRPGTLERWGLDHATLAADHPGLIMVRISGYGQTGPYAHRAGYASIGEAMGGLRHLVGEPDRPPGRCGISLGDTLTAMFGALGALAALEHRRRTGEGQVVDASIYESVLAVTESLIPEWVLAGHERTRTGATLPGVAPSNVYPTGDGGSVLVAANMDTVFRRLTVAMGRPELADDERFATHAARGAHAAELDALVAAWTSTQSADAVLAHLEEHGVPAGPIYRAREMLADPHFAARRSILSMADPRFGEFPMQGVFPRLSGSPGEVHWLGPELGEHTDEVLTERLGYTPEAVRALRAADVI
ncbi:CaiB/BaiF CoA transferase family protein [Actinomycetospora flava]|uniref:CoA transferase n=1 Tax=Actinomycetospora flava TaxID=3129232 RepID=A0ABU8M5G0_9PSEU